LRLAGLPGVEVVGQVPDVRPHLGAAAVAVIPLRIARGVQNKVLEALAMGKPVVASPEALAGLLAKPGLHLLQASSPAEWVEAIGGLLDDPSLRRKLGAAGRCHVEDEHRWDRCLGRLLTSLGVTDRMETVR
jgi:glycosyltransferase involved in cell wall biosynthesis